MQLPCQKAGPFIPVNFFFFIDKERRERLLLRADPKPVAVLSQDGDFQPGRVAAALRVVSPISTQSQSQTGPRLTLHSLPHPQFQSSTADSAAHCVIAPTGEPPGSYSHWLAAEIHESFRLPNVRASCPQEENLL